MQKFFEKGEFARISGLSEDVIDEFVELGLLDPEGDGQFDPQDVLRFWMLQPYLAKQMPAADIAAGIRDGSIRAGFITDLLFPSDHLLGVEEVVKEVGLSEHQIDELRTSVGLTYSSVTRHSLFSRADVESFKAAKSVLDAGMPWQGIIEVSRVYGDAFRRIAQTEVRLLDHYLVQPLARSGSSGVEISIEMQNMIDQLQGLLDPLFSFFHRSNLVMESAREVMQNLMSLSEGFRSSPVKHAAIVFVDLSTFTTLAEVHGDETAADLLDRVDTMVRGLSLEHEGNYLKQIGDAFMLAFSEPGPAAEFAVALSEAARQEHDMLPMRTGIHYGPVLYRIGDYVGNTVNVASRLATEAMPDEILMTEPVAEAARAVGIQTISAGMRVLRGTSEPLSLHRVPRADSRQRIDPVCGMTVGDDAAARLTRDGEEVLFCSEKCLRDFLADPAKYAPALT